MATPPSFRRLGKRFVATPPEKNYLWHLFYNDKERRLATFLGGGLWLSRLDQFGDSKEGQLPDANLGLLRKAPTPLLEWVVKQYVLNVKRSFASCWHMSDNDPSPDAWQIFGGAGNGVAIRTTPDSMRQTLAQISGPDGPVHFAAVRYVDHSIDEIPEGNVIEAAFVVQSNYAPECEARVLIHTFGKGAEYLVNATGPFGPLVTRPQGNDTKEGGLVGGQ